MKWIFLIIIFLIVLYFIMNKKRNDNIDKNKNQEHDNDENSMKRTINNTVEKRKDELKKVEKEIFQDRKQYLKNCKDNYSEYIEIAQELFPDIYKRMEEIDEKENPWNKYNSKAEQFKNDNNVLEEIKILEKAISDKVYTPGTYERLAILYGKNKDYELAYEVCKKWFDSDYWKIPNTASTSLRLLERMEKLKVKIDKALVNSA